MFTYVPLLPFSIPITIFYSRFPHFPSPFPIPVFLNPLTLNYFRISYAPPLIPGLTQNLLNGP